MDANTFLALYINSHPGVIYKHLSKQSKDCSLHIQCLPAFLMHYTPLGRRLLVMMTRTSISAKK
jgi:hypothetical protein